MTFGRTLDEPQALCAWLGYAERYRQTGSIQELLTRSKKVDSYEEFELSFGSTTEFNEPPMNSIHSLFEGSSPLGNSPLFTS